jgi:hypothetical protein
MRADGPGEWRGRRGARRGAASPGRRSRAACPPHPAQPPTATAKLPAALADPATQEVCCRVTLRGRGAPQSRREGPQRRGRGAAGGRGRGRDGGLANEGGARWGWGGEGLSWGT